MIIKRDSNYLRYVIKVPEKRVSLLKWEEGESQIVFIARCVRNSSEPAMRCLLAVPVVSAVHCCIGGRLHGIVFRLTLALTVTGFQPACIGTALAAPSGVVPQRQRCGIVAVTNHYRHQDVPVKHMQLENMQDHQYIGYTA